MANKRLRMTTLRQIIRLKAEGNSNRETHRLLGVSRKAVDKYTKRIDALAISYQELLVLEDADLNELLESPKKELHPDPEKHYKLKIALQKNIGREISPLAPFGQEYLAPFTQELVAPFRQD